MAYGCENWAPSRRGLAGLREAEELFRQGMTHDDREAGPREDEPFEPAVVEPEDITAAEVDALVKRLYEVAKSEGGDEAVRAEIHNALIGFQGKGQGRFAPF